MISSKKRFNSWQYICIEISLIVQGKITGDKAAKEYLHENSRKLEREQLCSDSTNQRDIEQSGQYEIRHFASKVSNLVAKKSHFIYFYRRLERKLICKIL